MANAKGLTFHCDLGSEPMLLEGDRQSLRRLLLILIDNAIKFTPKGGSVSLLTRRTYDALILKVRDTGFGIDPQDLPHIFERFYRSGQGRSQGTGGAGLGLAIAQAIAADHQATIHVESSLEEGSTFTVSFPVQTFVTATGLASESSVGLSTNA